MLYDLAASVIERGEGGLGVVGEQRLDRATVARLGEQASMSRAPDMLVSSTIQISGSGGSYGVVAGPMGSMSLTVIGSAPIARASSSAAIAVGASARTVWPRALAASA